MKGLEMSAVIQKAKKQNASKACKATSTRVATVRGELIDIDDISPHPKQLRRDFDAEELEALAQSLKESDLLQDILVRPAPDGSENRFQLICGERRLRAAKLAGWSKISCTIRTYSD